MAAPPKLSFARALDFFEDGTPMQEAIFTNTNDGMSLEMPKGLVGNSEDMVAPVETIEVVEPLVLQDHQLLLDLTGIHDSLAAIIARLDATDAANAARFAAIEANIRNLERKVGIWHLTALNLAGPGPASTAGVLNRSIFARSFASTSPVLPVGVFGVMRILVMHSFATGSPVIGKPLMTKN